jgi:hypothetical protein
LFGESNFDPYLCNITSALHTTEVELCRLIESASLSKRGNVCRFVDVVSKETKRKTIIQLPQDQTTAMNNIVSVGTAAPTFAETRYLYIIIISRCLSRTFEVHRAHVQ